jgi:hypothetical protein
VRAAEWVREAVQDLVSPGGSAQKIPQQRFLSQLLQ